MAFFKVYLQRLFTTVIYNGYLQRLFTTAIYNSYLQQLLIGSTYRSLTFLLNLIRKEAALDCHLASLDRLAW
jgi:hypothetical protein